MRNHGAHAASGTACVCGVTFIVKLVTFFKKLGLEIVKKMCKIIPMLFVSK